MGFGRIDDFMVGADNGAVGPILPRQPLDHLIGTLPSLGVNHLYTSSMLPLFSRSALLPPIEHDRDRVMFAMSIRR